MSESNIITPPEEYEDVMIKFLRDGVVRMEKGFYSTLFGPKYSIPPEYRVFNKIMLPHGFGGIRLLPEQVISWHHL